MAIKKTGSTSSSKKKSSTSSTSSTKKGSAAPKAAPKAAPAVTRTNASRFTSSMATTPAQMARNTVTPAVRSIVKSAPSGVGAVKNMNAPSSTTKVGTAIKRDTPITRGGPKMASDPKSSDPRSSGSRSAAPEAAPAPPPPPKPIVRTVVAPPQGFRPGIDPEFGYFQQMKSGGKVKKRK